MLIVFPALADSAIPQRICYGVPIRFPPILPGARHTLANGYERFLDTLVLALRHCVTSRRHYDAQTKGEVQMSRKDFRLIAETIKLLPSFDVKGVDSIRFDALCNRFADALATTNPRFNRERFIAACNGKGR